MNILFFKVSLRVGGGRKSNNYTEKQKEEFTDFLQDKLSSGLRSPNILFLAKITSVIMT